MTLKAALTKQRNRWIGEQTQVRVVVLVRFVIGVTHRDRASTALTAVHRAPQIQKNTKGARSVHVCIEVEASTPNGKGPTVFIFGEFHFAVAPVTLHCSLLPCAVVAAFVLLTQVRPHCKL